MSHYEQLVTLLEPLGIYDFDSTFQRGELVAVGQVLDEIMRLLEDIQQEMSLATAEGWGITQVADLLSVTPVATTAAELATAYATLLRVGGDSFTLQDINDTVGGCGVHAQVVELEEPNYVQVAFPDVAGIPEGYDEIKTIIDGILPAQVIANYFFWYRSWSMLEDMTWGDAQDGYSWYTLATGEK